MRSVMGHLTRDERKTDREEEVRNGLTQPEMNPSRCCRYSLHTLNKMLAAICITSALARRSAPERPSWSFFDNLPAPRSILPGSPVGCKRSVADCGRSGTPAPRFKKTKNKSLRCYLGHRIQTPFIHRSSLVHERFNDCARVDLTAGRVIGM